jgi:hypothetical protein
MCSEYCSDEDSDDGYMEDFFSREACSAPSVGDPDPKPDPLVFGPEIIRAK